MEYENKNGGFIEVGDVRSHGIMYQISALSIYWRYILVILVKQNSLYLLWYRVSVTTAIVQWKKCKDDFKSLPLTSKM